MKLFSNFHKLRLRFCLQTGQVFNWKRLNCSPYASYYGVINDKGFILEEKNEDIYYSVFPSSTDSAYAEKLLYDFFNLHICMDAISSEWAVAEVHGIKELCETFRGLRIIQQNPLQCTISFICSANNNISRIQSMVWSLCEDFGEKIEEIQNPYDSSETITFYTFPTLESLYENSNEEHLRERGFGYRAPYLIKTIKFLKDSGGIEWFDQLKCTRSLEEHAMLSGVLNKSCSKDDVNIENEAIKQTIISEYRMAVTSLQKLSGVGAKVADCIALFSLGFPCTIPIDVHIGRVAKRDFREVRLANEKSLKEFERMQISNAFWNHYGFFFGGWAQCLVFLAEIPECTDLVPAIWKKRQGKFVEVDENANIDVLSPKKRLKS